MNDTEQPLMLVIAGPNGAGKTTLAFSLLPHYLPIENFVNADEIARGISPVNPARAKIDASRLMIERVERFLKTKQSFSFETTGASHSSAGIVRRAKSAGYRVGLVYIGLNSVELAKARVENRVRQGGHDIPIVDIERRFARSLTNLQTVLLPAVDFALVFDNSEWPGDFIAEKHETGEVVVYNQVKWDSLRVGERNT